MEKEIIVKGKKIPVIKGMVGLILIIALVGSCVLYVLFQGKSTDELIVQGSIKMEETNLNATLAGTIGEVLVEEGDQVKAGDTLIVMKSDTVEAKLQQAEGAQAAAEAQAEKAAAGARDQEVAQAKAGFEYAQKTYDRMKALVEQEAISEAAFDQVEAQYTGAKEVYKMAMEGARSEDKAAANALVQQAGGAVAEVNSYLENSKIKAPMDGVVTSVNAREGELVSTGMPLVAVTAMETPWVEVNVKETDLARVQLHQIVTLKIAAYPDQAFKGEVIRVNQKPDFATKRATNENGDFDVLSYGVKIKLIHGGKNLYPNMTVLVDFGKSEGLEK